MTESFKTKILGRYAVGPVLGKGLQATVRKGRDLHTNSEVALRIVNRRDLTPTKMLKLEMEINMMKAINHPNVVALRHFEKDMEWQRADGTAKRVALMVLENAENGELFDYLVYTGHFSDAIARAYMRQLLSALTACHSNLIFHRDIKPENILLDENFQLKLADFGLSTFQEKENAFLFTDCGTRSYLAPEVLAGSPYLGGPADVWSVGVVLFIMLTGNPPFQEATRKDWWFNTIVLNRHDKFWCAHLRSAPHMSSNLAAQRFINRIFQTNPADRASIVDLMSDPWLTHGPILTPEELKFEMTTKKKAVLEGRERAAREAGYYVEPPKTDKSASEKAEFNVFAADVAYRSISAVQHDSALYSVSDAAAETIPECELEKIPQTSLFTGLSASRVIEELQSVLHSNDPASTVESLSDCFGIQATLTMPAESFEFEGELVQPLPERVTFTARLARVNFADVSRTQTVYSVEFLRVTGGITSFHKLFKAFNKHFSKCSGPDDNVHSPGEPSEPPLLFDGFSVIN
jgi:serine/threonine protein kinase